MVSTKFSATTTSDKFRVLNPELCRPNLQIRDKKTQEKEQTLTRFKSGNTHILVKASAVPHGSSLVSTFISTFRHVLSTGPFGTCSAASSHRRNKVQFCTKRNRNRGSGDDLLGACAAARTSSSNYEEGP